MQNFAPRSPRAQLALGVILLGFALAPATGRAVGRSDLRGVPVRAFSPSEYGAHPQCWSMVQDPRGLVHVANTEGLLSFDGARWQHRRMANDAAVTAVCVGPDANVYLGATGHMARLVADEFGELQLEMLGDDLAADDTPVGDVWYATATSSEVFMASLTGIYRVRTEGNVQRIDRAPGLDLGDDYFAIEVWRDTLWVAVDGRGLYRWTGEEFESVVSRDPDADPKDPNFAFRSYHLSDLGATESHLVIVEADRLFRFDGSRVTRFETAADSVLASSWVYTATDAGNGRLAVGTVETGAYVFDAGGNTVGHWDDDHGLLGNAVSKMGSDREGGLWVCQESGVIRLDLTAPIEISPEVMGLISSAQQVDGSTYVSTSQGLYRLGPQKENHPRFESIGNADDFTGMVVTTDGFFVVSSGGIARWSDGKRGKLLHLNYPASPTPSRHFEHVLFLDSRDGLVVVDTEGSELRAAAIEPLPVEGLTVAEGRRGELWVGSRVGTVMRVTLDESDLTVASVESYGAERGVPKSNCGVASFGGRILLGTGRGIYELKDDRFDPIQLPAGGPSKIDDLRPHGDKLWVLADGNVGYLQVSGDGEFDWNWERALSFHERTGRIYAFAVLDSTIWASQAGRLLHWNVEGEPETRAPFSPILRSVESADDSTLWSGITAPPRLNVDFAHNSMRFEFAAATLRGETGPTFQSMLDGHDTDWSQWTTVPFRDYSNLREGKYVLKVRAMDAYGTVSNDLLVDLQVRPPWNRTLLARSLFALLWLSGIALLCLIVIDIRSRQLQKQKRGLQIMVEESTEQLAFANLELRSTNKELERLNRKLRRVDHQRSELLGIAAHDLKNPLSSIRMVANALTENADPESDAAQLYSIIDEASERMLERIQGLLSSAAAEAGEMKVELGQCDLLALVREVVEIQAQTAATKEQTLQLEIDLPELSELWIRGDHGRLKQAFENLVSNAIKYSPPGSSIEAVVKMTAEDVVRLQVRDRGPGLNEHDIEKLFKPFQRLTPRPTADEDSCGLGLYIVKRVVEHHDGKVWLETELGEGSTFGFDLPCPAHLLV